MTYWKLSTCGCDLFNYTAIKFVTHTASVWLNRYVHSIYVTNIKRAIITLIFF